MTRVKMRRIDRHDERAEAFIDALMARLELLGYLTRKGDKISLTPAAVRKLKAGTEPGPAGLQIKLQRLCELAGMDWPH